jgi:uncharacterized protein YcbX
VFRPDHDLAGTIARLFIHPVKSCAGIEVREALLTDTGLDLDRAWMVVDPQGVFLTQRDWPRMALVRPELRSSDLVLRAPGMLALHLSLDRVEQPATVRVWDDTVPAWDMGAVAAQWFTDFLGTPCRLVRFDPAHRRLSSLKWTGGVEAPNQFADGFPVLVASQASLDGLNERLAAGGHAAVGMERFDGLHILADGGEAWLQHVKPCTRCPIPDIDPATAQRGTAVGDTLRGYRQDARMNGGITFGMNAIVREGAGLLLRVGQPVAANLKFD